MCAACPLRGERTAPPTGRTLNVHAHHAPLAAARRQAAVDTARQAAHRRWRPPVERMIARLVAHGHRRAPPRGAIRTDRRLHHRAAALNLRRLTDLGPDHRNDTRVIAPAPT